MIFFDSNWPLLLTAFIFILYAEIHYRIPGLPNRLFSQEPEIIFDAPWRVECGKPVPVLLLIKDSNRYPIEIVHVKICIRQQLNVIYMHQETFQGALIQTPFWHHIFYCPLPESILGLVAIEAQILYRSKGKLKMAITDNYRRTSHAPLQVLLDDSPLPAHERYYFGDLHYHSYFTNDQVEFGAPIDATQAMAQAQGLSFFAITDHSYDLDDRVDDFLINDPNLPKWRQLLELATKTINKNQEFIILPGEELSAGNRKGKNVHLLVINNDRFFSGAGDSAEKWFHTKADWRIGEVLDNLEEKALSFAAHPTLRPSFLQRLLFNRDAWSIEDYLHPRLTGVQIWNGQQHNCQRLDLQTWIKQLLQGKKSVLIAGNDAHGNFNRSRQISIPFWQMAENDDHVFGKMKTALRLNHQPLNLENLLSALKNGCCLITDGPIIDLQLQAKENATYFIGDICTSEGGALQITAQSSATFGVIDEIALVIGDIKAQCEERKDIKLQPFGEYRQTILLNHLALPRRGYIRAEVKSKKGDQTYRCFTNPIYLEAPTG